MDILLSDWVADWDCKDSMIWRGSALGQFEELAGVQASLGIPFGFIALEPPRVIAEHTSKSITLPVVQVPLQWGLSVLLRMNFYDCNVVVISDRDIDMPPNDRTCFFEGVPQGLRHPPWGEGNKRKFSASITSQGELVTYLGLLMERRHGTDDPPAMRQKMKQHHHDGHGLNDLVTIRHNERDPNAGGASHTYMLDMQAHIEGPGVEDRVGYLCFQHGPRTLATSTPGILDEALIAIIIDRQECFQAGPFSGPHNEIILGHLRGALAEMKARADERAARRVLGKNIK